MKLHLTFHTDNPNIDTVHFTLRLKQAHTQVQRLEIILEMFKLTLEE
jgi:hypothetical protein